MYSMANIKTFLIVNCENISEFDNLPISDLEIKDQEEKMHILTNLKIHDIDVSNIHIYDESELCQPRSFFYEYLEAICDTYYPRNFTNSSYNWSFTKPEKKIHQNTKTEVYVDEWNNISLTNKNFQMIRYIHEESISQINSINKEILIILKKIN